MKITAFLFFILLFVSCNKQENELTEVSELTGIWQHSFAGQPRGSYLYGSSQKCVPDGTIL